MSEIESLEASRHARRQHADEDCTASRSAINRAVGEVSLTVFLVDTKEAQTFYLVYQYGRTGRLVRNRLVRKTGRYGQECKNPGSVMLEVLWNAPFLKMRNLA